MNIKLTQDVARLMDGVQMMPNEIYYTDVYGYGYGKAFTSFVYFERR